MADLDHAVAIATGSRPPGLMQAVSQEATVDHEATVRSSELRRTCAQRADFSDLAFDALFVDRNVSDWESAFLRRFNAGGLVTFSGISTREEFLRLLSEIGAVSFHPHSDRDGLTPIVHNAAAQGVGYRGFTSDAMEVQTARSTVTQPPTILAVWCKQQATDGGESVLVDGRALLQRSRRFCPPVFAALCERDAARFGADPDPYVGPVLKEERDHSWRVCFRSDELATFSPRLRAHLGEVRGMLAALTMTLLVQEGQVYILSNLRWLHGRSSFVGHREMFRALLNPHKTGWPANLRAGFMAG